MGMFRITRLKLHRQRAGNVTFLIIGVNLERANASVLGLATRVDTFLLVHQEPLMTLEGEGLVESSSFAAIQFQRRRGSVSRHSDRVPLPVIDGYCRQPDIALLRPKAIQIVPEVQPAVFDLESQPTEPKFQTAC